MMYFYWKGIENSYFLPNTRTHFVCKSYKNSVDILTDYMNYLKYIVYAYQKIGKKNPHMAQK